MSKVVVETARSGSYLKSKKTSLRIKNYNETEHDLVGGRISSGQVHQYGIKARQPGDRIGPLRRFLRSKVGLPWDGIFSEIVHFNDRRTIAGWHLLEHVKLEVSTNCFIDANGFVYDGRFKQSMVVYGFYVHPMTKVLCWKSFPKFRIKSSESKNLRQINNKQYGRIKGVWYFLDGIKRSVPLDEKCYVLRIDDETYFATIKRQLNSKEISGLGLSDHHKPIRFIGKKY